MARVLDETMLSTITETTFQSTRAVCKQNKCTKQACDAINNEVHMLQILPHLVAKKNRDIFMPMLATSQTVYGNWQQTNLIIERAREDLQQHLSQEEHTFDTSIHIAKQIMRRVLHIVQTLHDVGISHNDIKPENIVIRDGTAPYASCAFIDFGFATHFDVETTTIQESNPKTNTRIFNFGTVAYRHPSLMRQQPSLAWRHIDLFACGILCYFILFNMLPIDEHENSEIYTQVATQVLFLKPDWHTHFAFPPDTQAHPEFLMWVEFIHLLCLGTYATSMNDYIKHPALRLC